MAALMLPSQSYLAECFLYDAKTGTISVEGYLSVKLNGILLFGHRIIWKLVYGVEPVQVDHRNLSRADNWLTNLRDCSLPQNLCNKSIYRNNKSGFKGVSIRKGRWRATIQVDRKARTIGSYATAEEAHAAYCTAADRLHGEYASYG